MRWSSRLRSRRGALVGALVLAVVVVTAVALLASSEEQPAPIEVGGMEMSRAEVADMVEETMGERRLSDVELGPYDEHAATLEPSVVDGVKVFELRARPVRWEYRERQSIAAWAYQGRVPGPAMVVDEGDRVRVRVTNGLPEPTTVHWHGVDLPFAQDGVPGLTQEPIEPGATYEYEFTAKPAGTRFYHTHGPSMMDEARQLDMGLAGPLIIRPRRPQPAARDYTLVLDEWNVAEGGLNAAMMSGAGHAAHDAGYNLFTINGRAAPGTAPLTVSRGELVRLRLINAGTSTTHPMHLHGHQFTVTAADGNPVPPAARQRRNVITVSPGETYDIEFRADNPGLWMFHCHELHHADAGMMTIVRYAGFRKAGGRSDGADAAAAKEPAAEQHAH